MEIDQLLSKLNEDSSTRIMMNFFTRADWSDEENFVDVALKQEVLAASCHPMGKYSESFGWLGEIWPGAFGFRWVDLFWKQLVYVQKLALLRGIIFSRAWCGCSALGLKVKMSDFTEGEVTELSELAYKLTEMFLKVGEWAQIQLFTKLEREKEISDLKVAELAQKLQLREEELDLKNLEIEALRRDSSQKMKTVFEIEIKGKKETNREVSQTPTFASSRGELKPISRKISEAYLTVNSKSPFPQKKEPRNLSEILRKPSQATPQKNLKRLLIPRTIKQAIKPSIIPQKPTESFKGMKSKIAPVSVLSQHKQVSLEPKQKAQTISKAVVDAVAKRLADESEGLVRNMFETMINRSVSS